jgi:chromosome segregation protein
MELGGIDPEVAAEHDAVEERFSFLSEQSEDLVKAKDDLEKIIAKLEAQSRTVFKDSFEKITDEFTRYFAVLFGGGTAKLELMQEETDDGVAGDYGIDIKAQPPGKRVQSLAMLSGGERALTSVALLFAILTVNPSPFVMLDEVDAALDEANTSRFADLLGQLSQQTQFIVVTHNRDTMRSAERLYGVTMDETGISTLLSIKLPEAERVVA